MAEGWDPDWLPGGVDQWPQACRPIDRSLQRSIDQSVGTSADAIDRLIDRSLRRSASADRQIVGSIDRRLGRRRCQRPRWPRSRSIDRSIAWSFGADADAMDRSIVGSIDRSIGRRRCRRPRTAARAIDRSIDRLGPSSIGCQARHRRSPCPQPRVGRSHRRTGEENADADLRAAGRAEDAPTTEGVCERTAGESAVIDGWTPRPLDLQSRSPPRSPLRSPPRPWRPRRRGGDHCRPRRRGHRRWRRGPLPYLGHLKAHHHRRQCRRSRTSADAIDRLIDRSLRRSTSPLARCVGRSTDHRIDRSNTRSAPMWPRARLIDQSVARSSGADTDVRAWPRSRHIDRPISRRIV